MAFINVEDTVAEIEVIVFSRQYSKLSNELYEENAVNISGKITFDDGDVPKIILSSLEPLVNNSVYIPTSDKVTSKSTDLLMPQRIFIRMDRFDEGRLAPVYRIASLTPGKTPLAIYDASNGKYISIKNVTLSTEEKVITRLKALFGNDNVVIK